MSSALALRPLAVLAALLPAIAHAQTDAAKPPPPPLPQVEVKGAANAYDPRRDDTAMKIVVGRQDLERYADGSVLDVLKRVPGVTVLNNGRTTQVQMRGVGGGYTQVLVNGERMPAGFTLDTLAPELVERIEVMRAPTAEFSAQGIAGTINIVLRRSVRAAKGAPHNGVQRQAKLGYLGASDIRGPNASIEIAERGEKSSYSLAANAVHNSLSRPDVSNTEETLAPDGAVRLLRRSALPENGRMNRLGLTPKFNWTLDNGDTLEWQTLLTGSRFRNRVRTLVTTAVGSPPPLPDYLAGMEADYNALNSSLAWTHAFASGATLDARLSAVGEQGRNLQLRRRRLAGKRRPCRGPHARARPPFHRQVHAETRERPRVQRGLGRRRRHPPRDARRTRHAAPPGTRTAA